MTYDMTLVNFIGSQITPFSPFQGKHNSNERNLTVDQIFRNKVKWLNANLMHHLLEFRYDITRSSQKISGKHSQKLIKVNAQQQISNSWSSLQKQGYQIQKRKKNKDREICRTLMIYHEYNRYILTRSTKEHSQSTTPLYCMRISAKIVAKVTLHSENSAANKQSSITKKGDRHNICTLFYHWKNN